MRRSQTSLGANQADFYIEKERDIIKGIEGKPSSGDFASRVSGSDTLTITKKVTLKDLSSVCSECLRLYTSRKYKNHFDWIDKIRHIRDKQCIKYLNEKLVGEVNSALKSKRFSDHGLHLIYPTMYDPESVIKIVYKGFRCSNEHNDLTIEGYLKDLDSKHISTYTLGNLENHSAHEVDQNGNPIRHWKIGKCLMYEVDIQDDESNLEEGKYMLLDGVWYKVDAEFSNKLDRSFNSCVVDNYYLPLAKKGYNEKRYNEYLKSSDDYPDFLCLDGCLVKPTDAMDRIEVCDFYPQTWRPNLH